LVGVNGAGRTTLLRLLDFCNVSDGDIEIFGTPHHLTAARRRSIPAERFNPPYLTAKISPLRARHAVHA
jgi:ABC-type uncharacterized transport system ATPase subunit